MARCDVRRGECEERSETRSNSDRRGKRAERREKREEERDNIAYTMSQVSDSTLGMESCKTATTRRREKR